MNEQVSWKGQSFTLLVFGGIVFLCSIFFVLGMLVGRGQGQRAAQSEAVAVAAKAAATEARAQAEKSSIASYESIETGKEVNLKPTRTPEPAKPSAPPPVVVAAAPTPKPAPKPPAAPAPAASAKAAAQASAKMIYLQVAALEKDSAANKQVEELRKKGFSAVSMGGGEGANVVYRVQVGPFSNAADAEIAKRKLEALGYKPIRK